LIDLIRKEKEQLIVDLYNNGSTYRQIAQEARISLRDIKGILNRANGIPSLSKSSQAYLMFSEGNSPTEVAIALDMREPEVSQLYKESWTLKQLHDLNSIYLETKGDLWSFVKLFKLSRAAGLTAQEVIKLLLMAKNDLLSIEQKCEDLKKEEAILSAKNLDGSWNISETKQRHIGDIQDTRQIPFILQGRTT
jgi:DNA-binding CsgD family transcriptional regulator